ncbi:uncharacterized protein P884DRAFT_255355 [Thermothelomyces heterothallicus CBS 202.75]|uniref:uncharacterized protein n=1 Tax=Thermothelomyces heterothallicus CBS 202.75 TaxID=1149848 RepID=UPI0037433835
MREVVFLVVVGGSYCLAEGARVYPHVMAPCLKWWLQCSESGGPRLKVALQWRSANLHRHPSTDYSSSHQDDSHPGVSRRNSSVTKFPNLYH